MYSVLFSEPVKLNTEEPECFRDLNLDQFLEPVLKNENLSDLAPWFYTPLPTEAQAVYRQEIQRDLLKGSNLKLLDDFSREICTLADREEKANADFNSGDPWRCHYLLYGHILDNGEQYVRLVSECCRRLPEFGFTSAGLRQAAGMLEKLARSSSFQNLAHAQEALRRKFDSLQYIMQIRYGTIRVKKYEGEADLSRKITALFRKFQSDQQPDYRKEVKEEPYADHVEAAILQCVSRLYPKEFEELEAYVKQFSSFIDRELLRFCRELRFYIDWLLAIEPMKENGLPFCFPDFQNAQSYGTEIFDLMLAKRIGSQVVKNDFSLEAKEAILVVTGPNQGGKTTFARALGQIHYLSSLGLCIPGKTAGMRLTDQVLTHFGREDSRMQRSGRLQDDLQRLQKILSQATSRSFLVINEIFASTPAQDGMELGKKMIEKILNLGSTAVLVTFLSELAAFRPETVSMMSIVDPEHPELRTFRILRKPPDQRTYAMTLAQKHGLTYEDIMRRIPK